MCRASKSNQQICNSPTRAPFKINTVVKIGTCAFRIGCQLSSGDIGHLFCKVNLRNVVFEKLFLNQLIFYEVENSALLVGIERTPLDYVPSALTAELWECHSFQFIVWDTGSSDIYILFCNVNIQSICAHEMAIFVFISSIL